MADSRRLEAELRFDTDVLIFDTLIYNTTKGLLEVARNPAKHRTPSPELSNSLADQLLMVESFLTIFKSAHPTAQAPVTLAFRLQLLRFTTLFAFRRHQNLTTPSLPAILALRRSNRDRAEAWHQSHSAISPYPNLPSTPTSGQEFSSPETQTLPTLLDLLPSFIDLTAARARLATGSPPTTPADPTSPQAAQSPSPAPEWTTTPRWLELAVTMMLQAVLEQHLMYNRSTATTIRDSIREAFAWGPLPDDPDANDARMESIVPANAHDPGVIPDSEGDADASLHLPGPPNHPAKPTTPHNHHSFIFTLPSDSVSNPLKSTWYRLHSLHLDLSHPQHPKYQKQKNIHIHHLALQSQHPLSEFEAQLLSFLSALHEGLGAPVLVRLEGGEVVEGVSAGWNGL